jgi:DmsE family decaheme c-type cytochrome
MKPRVAWLAMYITLGASLVFSSLLAQPAQGQEKGAAQSKTPAAASAKESEYVGADTCKTCHEDLYNAWEKSPHWKTTLNKREGASHQGCEACHGPGSAHVEGGGDKTKIFLFEKAPNKEINARCLSCHAGGTEHLKVVNSIHSQNDVSCISCHSPHHPRTKEFLLVKAQPELCFGCHLQQKPQFDMPFHHRVNEGLIQCSDCHNVHGTVKPKQVRTSAQQDAICFTCHADKQGPFVFEHDPVKTEGCLSCHVPHGGPNQHMLRLSTVNLLCLQCHTNSFISAAPSTPSFHNQAAQFQACTLCHTQIHGSNFDRFFFK